MSAKGKDITVSMKNNLNALESLHRGKLLKSITISLHEPPIKDWGN